MIQVGVSGARGRMGKMLCELVLQAEDLELQSVLEKKNHPDLGTLIGPKAKLTDRAKDSIGQVDVWLDFSLPQAVMEHLPICVEKKKPLVTGTTGFTVEQLAELKNASSTIPLVVSSNMSRGVYGLAKLVKQAAGLLEEYDVEIMEIHHKHKVDAPSGTAKQLVEVIQKTKGNQDSVYGRIGKRKSSEIGISALRGGDVVGEHQVFFLGAGEQIILTHRATTREHFCQGALAAVRWIYQKGPGFYSMEDVFSKDRS